MAVKIKLNDSSYPYAWDAKVSLINSGIPGRKSKDYFVASYAHVNQRAGFERVFTDSRAPLFGNQDHSAAHSMLPLDQVPFIGPPWPGEDAGDLFDRATSALISKVQKTRDTGFNGAVFLGELSSTWGMFVGTARRVVTAYRRARKGDFAGAARSLAATQKKRASKGVANNWLELQYGWLPLLSDIDSAARKLADLIKTRPVVHRVSATSSLSRVSTSPVYTYVDYLRTSPGKRVLSENFSVRIGVAYTVPDEIVALAAELGFTNPALIAWELLPLSFVLDWIVSVGDWLQAISTFHGLAFCDGYDTIKGDVVTSTSIPGYSHTSYKWIGVGYNLDGSEIRVPVPDFYETASGSMQYSRSSGFRRTRRSAFPNAPLPKVDIKGSVKKAITSWALLRQRMR